MNSELWNKAISKGCRPVWRPAIVKQCFALALHCNCVEENHGNPVRRITEKSLEAKTNAGPGH